MIDDQLRPTMPANHMKLITLSIDENDVSLIDRNTRSYCWSCSSNQPFYL